MITEASTLSIMIQSEVLEAIEQMSNLERLKIIEHASRLMREDMERTNQIKVKGKNLAEVAEIMRPHYEDGSGLAEFTDLNNEDFYEYENYA